MAEQTNGRRIDGRRVVNSNAYELANANAVLLLHLQDDDFGANPEDWPYDRESLKRLSDKMSAAVEGLRDKEELAEALAEVLVCAGLEAPSMGWCVQEHDARDVPALYGEHRDCEVYAWFESDGRFCVETKANFAEQCDWVEVKPLAWGDSGTEDRWALVKAELFKSLMLP